MSGGNPFVIEVEDEEEEGLVEAFEGPSPAQIQRMMMGAAGWGDSKVNGARTPNRGPCQCGYKHWCDGVEYDFVFRFPTNKGVFDLGFNCNDNPYSVAEQFIVKHGLSDHTFYANQLVSDLSAKIRTHIAEAGGHHADLPAAASTNNIDSIFQAGVMRPESTIINGRDVVYHDFEIKEKKVETEKHQQDVAAEVQKAQDAKERAQKMREQSDLQKEEDTRLFIERQKQIAASKIAAKDPAKTHRVIVGGVAKYVTAEEKEEMVRNGEIAVNSPNSPPQAVSHRKEREPKFELGGFEGERKKQWAGEMDDDEEEVCNCPACVAERGGEGAEALKTALQKMVTAAPKDATAEDIHPGHVLYYITQKGDEWTASWLFAIPGMPKRLAARLLNTAKRFQGVLKLPTGKPTTVDTSFAGKAFSLDNGDEEEKLRESLQKLTLAEAAPLPTESFLIVVDTSQPTTILKIQAPSLTTMPLTLTVNLTNTLQELCDHLRTTLQVPPVKMLVLSAPRISEDTWTKYSSTLDELGIKKVVITVKAI